MAQPVYTQADCAFYNDGTESGSTLISGSNIIVGNTGAEDKGFDTTILFRAVIQLAGKTEQNNFDLLVSKNGGAYNTRASIVGITAVDSSNLTQGDDTTQRLGGGANFVSNNNGVGDNGVTTALTTYTLNYEWEVLFSFEVDEADVIDGDYFDFRVYQDGGATALDVYSETLRVTVDKVSGTNYQRTISDSVGITDSISLVREIIRTLTESEGITDSISTARDISRSFSDSVGLTDALSAAIKKIVTLSDSVGVTDTVASARGILALISDSVGITDYLYRVGITDELDFEEGTLADWDTTSGGVSATTNAAMVGTYGMEVDADVGGGFDYGLLNVSADTNYFGLGFYFDVNSLNYSDGIYMRIVEVDTDGTASVNNLAYVLIANNSGSWQFRIQMAQDESGLSTSGWYTFTDEPHFLYVLITRATNSTSNDGSMVLKVDGNSALSLTGLDNYDAFSGIDEFASGALYRQSNAIYGTFYLDHFTLRNDNVEITAVAGEVFATISDSLGITDSFSTSIGRYRTLSESLGITDSISVARELYKSIIDNVGVTDTVSTARDISKTISDSLGITDSLSRSLVFLVALSDTIGITDSLLISITRSLLIQNSIGITDSLSTAREIFKTISDNIGITDAVQRAGNFVISIADSVGITDVVSQLIKIIRTISDSVGTTDSISNKRDLSKTLSDSLGITDSLSTAREILKTISDSLGITDTINKSIAKVISIADSVGITDVITVIKGAVSVIVNLADTVGITDTISNARNLFKTIADAVGLTDDTATARDIIIALDDIIGLTDFLQRTANRFVNLADTVGITDVLSRLIKLTVTFSDSVGLTDTLEKIGTFRRTISENLGITDTLETARNIRILFQESESITDALSSLKKIVVSIADDIGITDSLSKRKLLRVIIQNNVGISDALSIGGVIIRVIRRGTRAVLNNANGWRPTLESPDYDPDIPRE